MQSNSNLQQPKTMNPAIKQITVYETKTCMDCIRANQFFDKHKIEVHKININEDSSATKKVIQFNNGNMSIPTIVIDYKNDKQKILTEPTWEVLTDEFLGSN